LNVASDGLQSCCVGSPTPTVSDYLKLTESLVALTV